VRASRAQGWAPVFLGQSDGDLVFTADAQGERLRAGPRPDLFHRVPRKNDVSAKRGDELVNRARGAGIDLDERLGVHASYQCRLRATLISLAFSLAYLTSYDMDVAVQPES
jgi:hypothetical protein